MVMPVPYNLTDGLDNSWIRETPARPHPQEGRENLKSCLSTPNQTHGHSQPGGKDHGGGGGRPASAGPCMDRSRRCQRYQKPLRMGPRKRQGADSNVAGLRKPSDLLQVRRSSSSKRRTKKAEPLRNAMSFPRCGSCLHPVTPGRGSSRPMSGQLARGNAASLFFFEGTHPVGNPVSKMPSMHAQVSQVSEVSEASADGSAKEAGSGQQCRKPAFTPLRLSQVRGSSFAKTCAKKAEPPPHRMQCLCRALRPGCASMHQEEDLVTPC